MQLTKHWAATLDDYAIDLGWSPDGTLLAAASAAGPVYLFASGDGVLQHTLPGHEGGTNCLAWAPVGPKSVSRSRTAEVGAPASDAGNSATREAPETGGQGPELKAQGAEPKTSSAQPETRNPKPETSVALLATGGQDGAVKFWDATAGQHTATAKLGNAWVEHLAWRSRLETGDGGQKTGDRGQETGDRGQGAGDRGQETGDGRQEAGDGGQETGNRGQGAGDGGQETGDSPQKTGDRGQETGGSPPLSPVSRPLSPVSRPLSPVPRPPSPDSRPLSPALLFAAAGRTLAALRPDATIAHTFKPAPKTISALAMQPALSLSNGPALSLSNGPALSLSNGPALSLPNGPGGSVAAAYFGGVVLWDTDDFVAQKELPYANGIHALVWSPDGKWLVSGNQDPSVHLWIPEQDVELHMSGYETKVKFLSFDHTSRWLATGGGSDGCVWDCTGAGPEGREPAMLPHESPVCAVKFQNTHGLLATASQDGVVQLWSPDRKQPLRATVRMPSAATRLAWSPDDQYLAIGTEKGVVYVLKCVA